MAAAERGSEGAAFTASGKAHLCLCLDRFDGGLRIGTLSNATLRRRCRLAQHQLRISACRVGLGTTAAATSRALGSICEAGQGEHARTASATRRRRRTVAIFFTRGLLRALLRTGAVE